MIPSQPDISVIFATYNRADILRQTLLAMSFVNTGNLRCEFVVVDNNSSDNTPQVIDSFADKMPLIHLFEKTPGKSAALNLALETVTLGKIIVFTDDDVMPSPDWLFSIKDSCDRKKDFDVFGGRILLAWPKTDIPQWANNRNIQYWAFGLHDLGDKEMPYADRNYPGGANYWVRRQALGPNIRFDSAVGPRPEKYKIMGTETSFLHLLRSNGSKLLYSPNAVVKHFVQPNLLDPATLKKRAFRWGKGMPHRGMCHPNLHSEHPYIWRLLRAASAARHTANLAVSCLISDQNKRISRRLDTVTKLGYDIESLRLSLQNL